ncbi:pyridoxal phosphate-dependent transferase [Mycotypha africana]|uniref:pyridoxal phosphate-dependent transferase n=1 Tax=Mycotypha africana TaxID=64632 RepID=UPI0023014847|nr:pyridoxal phosphate-dependent transferase [Mycotypha africana]KAI8987236.1 pyridoxal phosphate-dependent transferase [Mycotypha africana]
MLMEPPTEVGAAIPAHTPHAVSVMFPTWQDNIDYEEANPRVTSKMECGYPRFFIHPLIQKLCSRILSKYGKEDDLCMLFPTHKVAEDCRCFMKRYYTESVDRIRIVEFDVVASHSPAASLKKVPLHIVLFPKEAFPVAKQFWQHAGDIVSSRMADYCLQVMDQNEVNDNSKNSNDETELYRPKMTMGRSRSHYNNNSSRSLKFAERTNSEEDGTVDHLTYLEERYGRNLPIKYAANAKIALKRRIAGILTEDVELAGEQNVTTADELEAQKKLQGVRGMAGLIEDDVYLYPCGMSAIYHAFKTASAIGDESLKSVCFGFPYTDTLKILQKWGAGCHFYGNGEDNDIDDLEHRLESGKRILSLFCEFPSNPLLKSPDLKRIRALADKFNFLVVVDETIGNFCNVCVLPWADMVVSSLTKVFSGESNVMGGSMILNPNGRNYQQLKSTLDTEYEDLLWSEDLIFLERNSRNFKERSHIINQNAEALCDFLINHPKVEKVFYPKYTCRKYYDAIKLDTETAGYGGLFSMVLKDEKSAATFYNHLSCAKGPSLGTNFTLCSPYTILAHYTELDWASQYGVSRHLVRVSVGLEPREELLSMFAAALDLVQQ